MRLKLNADEIQTAIEEYVERHNPELEIESDPSDFGWTIEGEKDDDDADAPETQWPVSVDMEVKRKGEK